METINLSRRQLLKSSAILGGGLVVAYYIPSAMLKKAYAAPAGPIVPNAFVHIAPDNTITVTINKLEMGQGVNTSMAQLIAEELECDWTKIRCVSATVDPVYNHTMMGATQLTGGSSALISSWDQHRRIGASLREMLKAAAATRWGIPVSDVKAVNGQVTSKKGKFTYGELSEDAAKLTVPENPKLKDPKSYKLIGHSVKRVDAAEKANGKAMYGMDVRLPGMLYAMTARPLIPGARLASFNEAAAKQVAGVVSVVKFGDERVAVLATNTYAAKMGRDALEAKWNDSVNGKLTSEAIMKDMKEKSKAGGVMAANRGDVDKASSGAAQTLTAEFEFPYLAHATMEPMNCTINYDGKTCELWSGHQMPTIDRDVAAKILDLTADKVTVNTTYAGGSFGRRGSKVSDYVVEASQLAKIVKKPLKLVWSREDDMKAGFYRPMNYHNVKITLDKDKKPLAWDHVIVGQSVIGGSMFEAMMVKNGLEATIMEGVSDTKYDFTNFRCRQTRLISAVPTLWWRSVGHTHTAYAMETMIDELSEAMGKDPLQLRKELLAKSPRHMAVLNLLAKETGWGKNKPPKGRAWGLAIHESFHSVVAEVAEVSMKDGQPRVHKVWAAVDCGLVVNPEGARTQVEGAIVMGLSAAFNQQIQIADGQAVQSNFADFPMLRMSEMPQVKVAFVTGAGSPTGLGEPGLPPIAPAVANAIYRLTKKRLRALPFSRELQA